ncbi:hypothetical protein KI387_019588, partial [Taxus chinensis]
MCNLRPTADLRCSGLSSLFQPDLILVYFAMVRAINSLVGSINQLGKKFGYYDAEIPVLGECISKLTNYMNDVLPRQILVNHT